MSGFAALNTAISGLRAAQRAMDITGQNIVNANAQGYSRQAVRLATVGASTAASFHTGNRQAMVGGVQVQDIARIRDSFLEGTRVAAGGTFAALQSQVTALSGVEDLLAEPGDGGIQAVMDDFYASWYDLAQRPGDQGAGAVVLARGQTVADQLSFVSTGIAQPRNTSREELATTIGQVNRAATDLAEVNNTIRQGTAVESPVNELLDQRDLLVRELGDLAGAKATQQLDGSASVSINGLTIVSGDRAEQLVLSGASDLPAAASDPPSITLNGLPVVPASGQAAGLLAAIGTDLPSVSARLDTVAVALRDLVNTVHSRGFTLAGGLGGDFFAGSSASNLTVVPLSTADLAIAAVARTVDGSNALALADASIDSNAVAILGSDSPSQLWRNLVADVGAQVQGLQRAVTTQESVVATADNAVEADAGVNLDEEMAALLMYQRSYQASARVITAADEMLETLIRIGVVGR